MSKNVSLIIVHWNTQDLLRNQLTLLNGNKFQIIVVDNASKGSVDWVKKDFPNVELIQNKMNRGFAFACNQGALKAVEEWLLFLNPDVEINTNQIEEMINYAAKNNLDATSPIPQSHNYNNPIPTILALLAEFTPLIRIKRFLSRVLGIGMTGGGVKTLTGGCLLIRKDTLLNLGGWDERFFLWFEDSDLTKRLIENRYKIGWVPIYIKHKGGSSFERLDKQVKRDIFFHSMEVFAKKHFNLLGKVITSLIKLRYSPRKLLPELTDEISITVPNLKKELLEVFFNHNRSHLSTSGVEWIVVTSSIVRRDIWGWKNKFPEVRFIVIEKNKGFAETVNIGFMASSGKWIGTINDDVTLSPNWLVNLMKCFNSKVGSINPIIYKENEAIESAGIKILPYGKAQPIKEYSQDNQCLHVDATNAAAVIYSKEALNKVGLYDERFGSYLEDIDLSLRLERNKYSNLVALDSKVIHSGQSTSKNLGWRKEYYDFKNWIFIIIKNWRTKELIENFPQLILERLRNLSGLLKAF